MYITETHKPQKKGCRLRPQQLVIQFTDRFQPLFQTLIIAHPLLDLSALLATDAELLRPSTRVGYREHPDRMSSSGPALRTASSVANGSPQQSAARNLSGVRESLGEPIAGIEDMLLFHSIVCNTAASFLSTHFYIFSLCGYSETGGGQELSPFDLQ